MTFSGFTPHDFNVFSISGLDERMEAIKERIQPKFQEIGSFLSDDLALMAGNEMHLHIAKHARRTVNPPKDTWLAICHDKRGYKKHPHFQVGLFDDHVFLWLAYIYEVPNKTHIAEQFLQQIDTVYQTIPKDYVLSLDHTQKNSIPMEGLNISEFTQAVERFRDVKKAELLVGKHLSATDPLLDDGAAFLQYAKQTFETLMPLYKLSLA
ncbi:YktB family protein [Ammoniphilus sp. YIM 78166]|uniref:YktB family protein n=1 Tax=Ammoniphilus sp. YIM 78166 TaxID=1644106 RepID=UPI0010704053|nr:DUF1054 domain-containing protein [Ammoniphilus sp. YIM 78166]